MKLGSLFDGIGGFPLSATYHGIEPVWASEIEPFPIEVTRQHFPKMKHLGDITQINGAEIEPVDIITFGSPCQDLSVAGKRDGLEGKRSNLFYQAVRIIREMREATNGIYPRIAVWENVPGAFSSSGGQDFRSVLEEITESEIPMPASGKWATAGMVRGNGRSAAWRVLDAQYWGVPQRRKRIFLVADFAGQRAGEILFECEGVSGDFAESRKAREEVAAGAGDGVTESVFYEGGPGWISEGFGCLRAEGENRPSRPTHTVVARTVSAKWAKGTGGPAGDECQNLVAFGPGGQGDIAHAIRSQPSKADKPSSTTYIVDAIPINDKATQYKGGGATRNADGSGNGLGIGKPGDPMPTLTQGDRHAVAQLYENHGQDSRLTGPLDVAPAVHRKYGTGGNNTPLVTRGFEGDTARTLTARHDSSPCVDRGQDLVFAIRTAQLYENHAVRSFTPSQFGQYQESCGTLRANGGDLGGGSENLVSNNYTVRRLTPTECERLQGFPPVMEVRVSEMTRDEYIAYNLAAGNISVDFETGQVFAFRGPGGRRLAEPIALDGTVMPSGYRVVSIRCGEVKKQCRINRVVWIAANGVPPDGMVVDHINNVKLDNSLSNLQLLTPKENSTKAKEDGCYLTGDDNPQTKIGEETAMQICDDYKHGEITMRSLAEKYGISKSRVHQIIHSKDWTDIPGASDTGRYKALGNSVAVPCVSWIIGRIAESVRMP